MKVQIENSTNTYTIYVPYTIEIYSATIRVYLSSLKENYMESVSNIIPNYWKWLEKNEIELIGS